jgi:hypothetical protein
MRCRGARKNPCRKVAGKSTLLAAPRLLKHAVTNTWNRATALLELKGHPARRCVPSPASRTEYRWSHKGTKKTNGVLQHELSENKARLRAEAPSCAWSTARILTSHQVSWAPVPLCHASRRRCAFHFQCCVLQGTTQSHHVAHLVFDFSKPTFVSFIRTSGAKHNGVAAQRGTRMSFNSVCNEIRRVDQAQRK